MAPWSYTLSHLAKKAHICTTYDQFLTVLADWEHRDQHGQDLYKVIQECIVVYKDIFEVRRMLEVLNNIVRFD